jgi:hypothetical protein
VYIFYTDLRYESIEQSPSKILTDFLANLGGCLGLFTGVSFLSFFEVFEFLIEVIHLIKNKNKVHENSNK